MDESIKKTNTESFKLGFELLKHVTTLSSGSILLILALAERSFKESPFAQALFQAVFCFLISILTALVGMSVLAFNASHGSLSTSAIKLLSWGLVMSAIGFFGGMALVAIAVVRTYG